MRNWYCIYTKWGQEDTVYNKLAELPELEFFNPKLKRKKRIRGKYKEVIEELFPCYVFSNFNPYKYFHMIKYTRGVRRIVGDCVGNPYTVDESLIEFLKSKMENGFVRVKTSEFIQGEKVIVMDGPFSGQEGIFVNELKSNERVMLLLSIIQSQVRVEMPKDFIAKA